jgi:SAM-dependent methyltransferase
MTMEIRVLNDPVPAGTCCGGDPAETLPAGGDDVRAVVREKYAAVAKGLSSAAGCCCGPSDAGAIIGAIGYTAEQAAALPEGANLGLGCGNPLAHAAPVPGETVLDLGSGAGIDCFLAARAVGPEGRVIGVDMTPAMLERAHANALRGGYRNVEFRLGEIERLPVEDASVDLIVSNCVINLSPDKPRVFREALRVLKPGGRLVVSDLVLERELPEPVRRSAEMYAGCVAGASLKADYLAMMREAGFADVEVLEERSYRVGAESFAAGSPEAEAYDAVTSVKVRARKKA